MITGEQIIQAIRDVASEKPDFVYARPEGSSKCMYMHEGKPSCLIGQALFKLGVIDASIESVPSADHGNSAGAGSLLNYLGEQGKIDVSFSQRRWISEVQWNQDKGATWSDSVQAADEAYAVIA